MSQMNDGGTYWYCSPQFSRVWAETYSFYSATISLSEGDLLIDKDIQFNFYFEKLQGGYCNGWYYYPNQSTVYGNNTGGWVGFPTGSTSGSMSRGALNEFYFIKKVSALHANSDSSWYICTIKFNTRNKLIDVNKIHINLTNLKVLAKNKVWASNDKTWSTPGYVPSNCYCVRVPYNQDWMGDIISWATSSSSTANTWQVYTGQDNYVQVVFFSGTSSQDIRYVQVGQTFNLRAWSTQQQYWTPGGSGYLTTYYTALYVNGSEVVKYTSYHAAKVYGYQADSGSNCVYVKKVS